MGNVYGIDVSEHNGSLNWQKIRDSGISFAIVRSGYGVSHQDTQFQNNMAGALACGLPVGIYHFSYALSIQGAKKEAEFCQSLLEPYESQIVLPVFFDFEYDTVRYGKTQGVSLGKQQFNDHAAAFLEAMEEAGHTPGIYYNLDYKKTMVDEARLGDYVQWYAQYNSSPSWTGYDLWQKSSSHTIPGLSGTFDLNEASETFLRQFLSPGFSDVPQGAWYETAVNYCKNHGLMEGVSGTLFEPERPVTRAEAAALMMRLHKKI